MDLETTITTIVGLLSTEVLAVVIVLMLLAIGVWYFVTVIAPHQKSKLAGSLEKESVDVELRREIVNTFQLHGEALPKIAEQQVKSSNALSHAITRLDDVEKKVDDVHAAVKKIKYCQYGGAAEPVVGAAEPFDPRK